MVEVGRHPIERERLARVYTRTLERLDALVARDPMTPRVLLGLGSRAETVLAYGSVIDPGAASLHQACRIGAQAAAALYKGLMEGGRTVHMPLEKREIAITVPWATLSLHTIHWSNAWYLAAIARDEASLMALCECSIDVLRRSPVQMDNYQYAYAQTLQAFSKQDERACRDGVEETRDLLEDAAEEGVGIAAPLARAQMPPLVDAIEALLDGDTAALGTAVRAALEAHREFWIQDDHAMSPLGFVGRGALALSCVALDRGMDPGITSGYLPDALLTRPSLGYAPVKSDAGLLPMGAIPVGSGMWALCPYCMAPRQKEGGPCPSCQQATHAGEEMQLSPADYAGMAFKHCLQCQAQMPSVASRCRNCRAWQDEQEDS